jgi:hypothetical protein
VGMSVVIATKRYSPSAPNGLPAGALAMLPMSLCQGWETLGEVCEGAEED